jgi:hypothetical protein
MPPKLEFFCPCKTYLERVYNFKISKKTFLHDKFSVPQAKFSCYFYFFQFRSCYTRNKASGGKIIWRTATFHVLKRPPPMTGTQFFYLHHRIRRQNGPKPVKIVKPL